MPVYVDLFTLVGLAFGIGVLIVGIGILSHLRMD